MLELNIFLNNLLIDIFLFDVSEKKSESLMRIVLLHEKHILTKMHVQAKRLYFCFHFALDIILGDRCDRKTPKQLFYSKPHLLVFEFSKNVTFEEMLVLTSY